MSYDLNFFKRKTDTVNKADLEHYLTGLENITYNNGSQWVYHNKETGVYFSFEYYEPDIASDNNEDEYLNEYDDTGFSFNINFIRPHFFGAESFPIVEKFVDTFDLFILNPQDEGIPKRYEKHFLEKEWCKTNAGFAERNYKEWNLNYLELNKSNYSWEFCLNRKELQDKLGDNYFVPGIFYIKKKGTDVVETFCVWPDCIPYVLPKVDYIIIKRTVKRFFSTKEESGLVKYDDLFNSLKNYFSKQHNHCILIVEKANSASKEFNKLPIFSSVANYGEGVTTDVFVNVKSN